MDFADTAVTGSAHLASLGWPYLAVVVTRSALLLAAMKTRNAKFHAFVVILFVGQLILLAFRSYHIMQ